MWDLQNEYSLLAAEINSIGNTSLSNNLPIVEIMGDSVVNGIEIVAIGHTKDIKEQGIEKYNTVYGKYGRMVR